MVKEYEMKKAAAAYSRTKQDKSGIIDPLKLHSYKYNDDIFNNITRLCKIKRHFTCKYQNLCINCDKWVIDTWCDWKPWNENEIEQLKYETRDITTTQDSDPCWRRLSSVLLHQEHTSRSARECHKTYIELKLWKKKSDILSLSGMLTFEERRRAMGFN